MQALKQQLDELQEQTAMSKQQALQPLISKSELEMLKKRIEEAEKDRRNLQKEMFQMERDKIGLEASVKLSTKENKILKRKNQNQDDSLKRKEAIIADLER